MEHVFTDLQTRDSILRILQNRRLEIHNIDTLSNEQLFRIYKNFATPLSRRYKKYRNSKENHCISNKQDTNVEFIKQHYTHSMFVDDYILIMPRKRYTSSVIDEPSPMSEVLNCLDDYQRQLNTATKRIKISLP